jgi:MYXO-CTERM domain-containing protein
VPPQYDYGRTNGNNCVVGGLIMDGCGWPAPWTSRYIFGDNGSGSLWTLDVKPDRTGTVAGSVKDFGKAAGPASFRMGEDGALYVVEVVGGAVQRILPKTPTVSCGAATGTDGGVIDASTDTKGAGPDAVIAVDTSTIPRDTQTPLDSRLNTGGAGATGGTMATGGTLATGGVPATGAIPATGGVVESGGTTISGGAVATGGTTTTGSNGCGCHLGGNPSTSIPPLLVLGSFGMILHLRRRGKRTGPTRP